MRGRVSSARSLSSTPTTSAFSLFSRLLSPRYTLSSLVFDFITTLLEMHLLHFPDDGTPTLEFVGNNPQPYAILSHTWGHDDQEVTYRDIQQGTGEHKDGWQKLRFCRDQAKRDGLQYFWIDTCCIDKSSSAELVQMVSRSKKMLCIPGRRFSQHLRGCLRRCSEMEAST
jgi:hypothetical protein